MKKALSLSFLLFSVTACGDDNKGTPDAAVQPDGDTVDAPPDAPGYVAPTPVAVPLSTDGPDVLMSVAPGPNGSFYAAGYAAATSAGDKMVVLVRLTAAGALDTSFADNGVFTSAHLYKGGNDEIDVAVQSDGKVVVASTIANDLDAADKDIGLFRVDANGDLDTLGFGTAGTTGYTRLNLSTAHDTGTALTALDSQRGLAIGPSDQIFVHAQSRNMADDATTPRTDTDFTVARLAANGVLDAGYGTAGKHQLDLAGANALANSTARGIAVLTDGTVIASGYANAPGIGSTQAVLYRLLPDGSGLDGTSWAANGGVFYDTVLAKQTEIYNFAIDGDRITTAGYGRETDTSTNCCNQWISLRFDVSDGTRDATFGGTSNGGVLVDPSGMNLGNNCRNAVGLPGGKTALIGSAGPSGGRDAALAILTQNGALDTTYGTGVHAFNLDGTEDQFWGAAVNGNKLMLVGWKGVGSTQTDAANDNAYAVIVDLQ